MATPNDGALGKLMLLQLAGGHVAVCRPEDEVPVRVALRELAAGGNDALLSLTLACGSDYMTRASTISGVTVQDEWQRRTYDAILDALNGEDDES